MRNRITSVKCQGYNYNNDYNYGRTNERSTTTKERRPKIEHSHEPKYYIRIGTTGRLYVQKHEVEGYERDGFKIHKEE